MLTESIFRTLQRSALGLAALLVALVPPPVHGQEAGAPEPEAPDADSVRTVEELVVTAHRIPLPAEALTSAVTVFDREEIERSGTRRVSDLLRSVPGLSVVETGSWGGTTSLFVRGGESNYVQVLVDGVPVNQPGGDFDFSTLSLDNVERVEVVRGPVSVLYGSSAVSGVIQIFTRGGEGRPTASAGVRGGSHGTVDWETSVRGGAGPLGWSASVSRFATDGLRELNNRFHNTTGSVRLELADLPRTDASLSLRYGDHEAHTPTDGAGRAVDENQFGFGDRLVGALDAGYLLSDRLEARVQLRWHALDAGFDDAQDGPADTTGFYAFQRRSEVTRKSADARLAYHLPGPTVFTAGAVVEEEREESWNRSESGFGTSEGSLEADRENRGYYLEAVTRLADRVSLNAGFRLDDNEAFGSFETWRLGAGYDLTATTRVRASWGTAFKEPTFLENFSSGFVTGNPDLEPERSRSWEAGLEQELAGGRLVLGATWFDQSFEEMIQFTASPPEQDDPNFFNVAAAEARGLEVTAAVRPELPFTADLSWTRVDSEVKDAGFDSGPDAAFVEGQRLLRRPTSRVTAGVAWTPDGGGSVRLEGAWVGDRTDRDFTASPAERVVLDDYVRLDLAARWPVLGSGGGGPTLAPTLRVDNLLDADYEEVFNYPARGRTIFVGAEATLGL